METNILLESGTNELEILEFSVGGNYYGINVSKVREILPYSAPTPHTNTYKNLTNQGNDVADTAKIVNLTYCFIFHCVFLTFLFNFYL